MKPLISLQPLQKALVLLLSGIILFLASCGNTDSTPFTFQGTLVHNTIPVPGATVVLQSCNGGGADSWCTCTTHKFTVGSATTDANGHFVIQGYQSKIDDYWVMSGNYGFNFSGISFNSLPAVYDLP